MIFFGTQSTCCSSAQVDAPCLEIRFLDFNSFMNLNRSSLGVWLQPTHVALLARVSVLFSRLIADCCFYDRHGIAGEFGTD